MTIYPHPQDHELIENNKASPAWHKWFEQLKDQVNRGSDPSDVQDVSASPGIGLPLIGTNLQIRAQSATGGIVDVTANPQVEPGFDGQIITIDCQSTTKGIKLNNGNGLALVGGGSVTLKENDSITFRYNKAKLLWIENSRSIL